jgi:hypothetical protein
MNRGENSNHKRLTVLLLSAILLITSIGCKLPSIFNAMGNLGDTIKNMFENIGKGFGF